MSAPELTAGPDKPGTTTDTLASNQTPTTPTPPVGNRQTPALPGKTCREFPKSGLDFRCYGGVDFGAGC